MRNLKFIIGANATGKSFFINSNYADQDVDILDVYDYQQRVYEEAGFGNAIPFDAQFRCLIKANKMLLEDIIERLKLGKDVVVEQTFFKAKRRIAYIEAIRKSVDVTIEIYLMCPSESRWQKNIVKRKFEGRFEEFKRNAAEIEFPNPAEGFDKIYEVIDGVATLIMEQPRPEIVDKAKKELAEEAERIQAEDKAKQKRKELIESMNTRPFWHYCEVCGKKEYITAQQAFDSGWDYPPTFGSFGQLFQRTCGNCLMADSLYMKVMRQKLPIVIENTLTPEELRTWRRIKAEPESLLVNEVEENVLKSEKDGIDGITIYFDKQ